MVLVLCSTFAFSWMSLGVRVGSPHFRADSFVFLRSVIQLLCLLPFFRWTGNWRAHLLRGSVGIFSMWMLYYALGRLPLVMTSLLGMTSVLWAALLARLFLGETQGRRRLLLSGWVGIGLIVVLWPEAGPGQWDLPWDGVAAALACGFSMGTAQFMIRHMTRTRSTVEIVFWFGCVGAAFTAPFYFSAPQIPRGAEQWFLILAIGLTAVMGQLFITEGLRHTSAMIGSLCALTGNIWNLLLGLGFLGEVPPVHFWWGAAAVALGVIFLMAGPAEALSKVSTGTVQELDSSLNA